MIYLGNISSQDEFTEILTHELGHIVDLGILEGNKSITQQNFFGMDHSYFALNDPSVSFYSIDRINNTTRSSDA